VSSFQDIDSCPYCHDAEIAYLDDFMVTDEFDKTYTVYKFLCTYCGRIGLIAIEEE